LSIPETLETTPGNAFQVNLGDQKSKKSLMAKPKRECLACIEDWK